MTTSRASRATLELDPTPSPDDIERELETLRERLRAEGAVKTSALKPKAVKDGVLARLASEGFELSGTWVRTPVREQIRLALAQSEIVSKRSLSSAVRGVTVPELTGALCDLERDGELHRVLHRKVEAFVDAGAPVLAARSLRALNGVIAQLYEALGVVSKRPGLRLLSSDVELALDEARRVLDSSALEGGALDGSALDGSGLDGSGLRSSELQSGAPESGPLDRSATQGTSASTPPAAPVAPAAPATHHASTSAPRAAPPIGGRAAVLDALEATRDERTGLSFVPRVIQRLLSDRPLTAAHEMLLAAAREELIELRPEGGLGRLTSEELLLCPPGPGGTRLSWARRLGDGA
jgi:hypothetical protein